MTTSTPEVEKRITEQMLESGEIRLTEREQQLLDLPEHSSDVKLEIDDDKFVAQWASRGRFLHGDVLAERLQDYGQVGGLLRIRGVDGDFRLQVLPVGTAPLTPPIPPPEKPRETRTERARRARRQTIERTFFPDEDYEWIDEPPTIGFLRPGRETLIEQIEAGGFDPPEFVELRLEGEELATLDNFDELLAIDVANIDRMPHQEAVARHVLSRMRGRAVLADEVGLGKTIEAGLVVKELALRGLARRILILCPVPLREQWRDEMSHKFELGFDIAYRGDEVREQERLIVSLRQGLLKRDHLTARSWDVVIVDEAHRAAGQNAIAARELIRGLSANTQNLLFLTATPVQNDLLELYRLVQLLRPGTLESLSDFRRRFFDNNDKRVPKNPAELRRLVSSAMIRTTRAQAGVNRVKRRPHDVAVSLGSAERELYVLCTDLLRHVMTDRADTLRRRNLAHRLTASPYSMGTTALRMAERHPDPRVAALLRELGHRAMDMRSSARESEAMTIIHRWLDEHGRVLLFTQHTDTVTSLLRRLDDDGIRAVPFHAGMSSTARAASIGDFKTGNAQVLVSTDAGAEGQNLQFCNCVVNYDLPWNPMRIEQRIGRVDRLTQPRDEVFIANLYARNTIDEHVYRLLAEKLRMFELLFGQVTTVLGELDESKATTFEGRVMEALFAEDDAAMNRLLGELGADLESARDRASELICADSGLSSWLKTTFDHRQEVVRSRADELAPAVEAKVRQRQQRVQSWARRVLTALGAEVVHDTGQERGAFLTVRLPDEFAEELGDRTVLHLAFDRDGLDNHPDAELCAVGSPVFDELLSLMRVRGDIHVSVPVPPPVDGDGWLDHSQSLELVSRRFVPPGTWHGNATFRGMVGEAEPDERLVTVQVGIPETVPGMRRVSLASGEQLPTSVGTARSLIEAFESSAATKLRAARDEVHRQLTRERVDELERVVRGYEAQIAEAAGEDRERLERALSLERRRLDRQIDVRARVQLLAVSVDEDDHLIEERWRHRSGAERDLRYQWNPESPPTILSEASGRPLDVLDMCAGGHWAAASEQRYCDSCTDERCVACGPDGEFAPCEICQREVCGHCRSSTGGLCLGCSNPEREPELDTDHAIAWRLRRGLMALVGPRVAELVDEEGQTRRLVVPDVDVDDDDRIRVRAYAVASGLPADTGLGVRDLTAYTDEEGVLVLHRTTTDDSTILKDFQEGSAIDAAGVAYVPTAPEVDVVSERGARVTRLLATLREREPPPVPPRLAVVRHGTARELVLEENRLVERVVAVDADGSRKTDIVNTSPLEWTTPTAETQILAEGRLNDCHLVIERRNEAALIRMDGRYGHREWIAIDHEQHLGEQLAWYEHLLTAGLPGARLLRRSERPALGDRAALEPTESTLVERRIRPFANVIAADDDVVGHLTAVDSNDLAHAGRVRSEPAAGLALVPPQLASALLHRAEHSPVAELQLGYEVEETWHGHGATTRTEVVLDRQVLPPTLDDTGASSINFGVCRDGHLYEPGTARRCESCATWACRACDAAGVACRSCPTCGAMVCTRCLVGTHDVSPNSCEVCSASACAECGFEPHVVACPACERLACTSCRAGELCRACDDLRPASATEIAGLPVDLAASGAAVWRGVDPAATVVVIQTADRFERAILHGDAHIASWVAYGTHEAGDYVLHLAASRFVGVPVRLQERPLHRPPEHPAAHLDLRKDPKLRATWEVIELGRTGQSAVSRSSTSNDLWADVREMLGVADQASPMFVPDHPPTLDRFRDAPAPTPKVMTVGWNVVGDETLLVGDGLVVRRCNGDAVDVETIPWQHQAAWLPWVGDAWSPVPTTVATASIDDIEVAVLSLAGLTVLGLRVGGDTSWFSVHDAPDAAIATTLADAFGLGALADVVGPWTRADRVELSAVTNGQRRSDTIKAVAAIERRDRTFSDDTVGIATEALRSWKPELRVVQPRLDRIPQLLGDALAVHFARPREVDVLSIGVAVEQVTELPDGRTDRYSITLPPGEQDARRPDDVTGERIAQGVIDRDGHFVAEASRCLYCERLNCQKCTERVQPCVGCGQPICDSCASDVGELRLCTACAEVRPATRAEAREHGRLLRSKRMLVGKDRVHEVVYERHGDRWEHHADDGSKSPIEVSAVNAYLTAREQRAAGE